METRLTPNGLWSRSKYSYSAVVQAHPWGCPFYVLQPRLQDRGKVPKWEPRSRRGKCMGASPLHAITVGLICNLRTDKFSPQFLVVYDDLFETIHSRSNVGRTQGRLHESNGKGNQQTRIPWPLGHNMQDIHASRHQTTTIKMGLQNQKIPRRTHAKAKGTVLCQRLH